MMRMSKRLPEGSALRPARRERDGRGGTLAPRPQRGFSLIELMIALTLAGVLLFGLAVFFVSSSRSYGEADRVSRQIENGRYAMALLTEDIRHAAFYGPVGNVVNLPTVPAPSSQIPLPAALPDPCAIAIANVTSGLSIPIQGVDNVVAATSPSCVTDAVAGTDIIVIRRSNTTTIAAGNAVANGYYTQSANCATAAPIFQVAQSGFTLTDKDCVTVMPLRQYHVYIYYVAPCSVASGAGGACQAGDAALPTLKRVELCSQTAAQNPACANGAGKMSNPVPLVEGIENIQYEYGLDTGASPDGSPDTYTAAPASVTQWSQVVAVRVHLLARNVDSSPSFIDTKTYSMGLNADASANTLTPGGSFRRHAYTNLARVTNVSQRIETTFP